MLKALCASLCLVFSLASPVAVRGAEPIPATVDQLSWIAGHWAGEIGPARIEEGWLGPNGGSMLGVNRTIVDGKRTAFEFLRLEEDAGGIVYLASPGGRYPPTAFRLIELGEQRAVFSNPDHDFPQRVIYWREGDTLHARIEGTEDGEPRSVSWHWQLQE